MQNVTGHTYSTCSPQTYQQRKIRVLRKLPCQSKTTDSRQAIFPRRSRVKIRDRFSFLVFILEIKVIFVNAHAYHLPQTYPITFPTHPSLLIPSKMSSQIQFVRFLENSRYPGISLPTSIPNTPTSSQSLNGQAISPRRTVTRPWLSECPSIKVKVQTSMRLSKRVIT